MKMKKSLLGHKQLAFLALLTFNLSEGPSTDYHEKLQVWAEEIAAENGLPPMIPDHDGGPTNWSSDIYSIWEQSYLTEDLGKEILHAKEILHIINVSQFQSLEDLKGYIIENIT